MVTRTVLHRFLALLYVPVLVVATGVACSIRPTPTVSVPPNTLEPTNTSEPTVSEPIATDTPRVTEAPSHTPTPPSYDVETYGNLEDLDPSGQLVIYWYQHTNAREELFLTLVDQFNRTNQWGIMIQGEYQGSYDDLYQKVIAGIPDRVPSIAIARQYQAATYATHSALVALDPYVESEKWGYTQAELDDFFPVVLAADILPQFEARFGWPPYKSMEVMYYNEDWLAELGYTDPPETWDEFAEMACAASEQPFSRATDDTPGYGYVYSIDASQFATFVFSQGGDIINDNGTGYIFNSPYGLDALTLLQDMVEDGCAIKQTELYGDRGDFGVGRSLFTISSISRLPHYRSEVDRGAGFSWSVNPPPHTTPYPRLNIYGASQSIFVSTPEQQLAAWLFIKWMSEPEQQAVWASGTGYFPTRQGAVDLLADYFVENPEYEKAFTFMAMDYGIESPVTGYDECRSAISKMLTAVLGGEDVQPQLDMTVEMCNEYLEESAP